MPLIKGKSKQAFSHNVAAEMKSGKPQEQALAISYAVKRKAGMKKKMADGGIIDAIQSFANEPDPDRPKPEVNRDPDPKKAAQVSKEVKGYAKGGDIMKPKMLKQKEGRIIKPTGPFSVKSRQMLDEEDDEMHSMKPKMAEGGSINHAVSMDKAEEDMQQEPQGLQEDDDQMKPSDEEIMSNKMPMLAEGGLLDEESEIEHAASIAAAIMAKRKRMAEGGMVDLAQNAEEEPNNEDQMSFEALKKENYSESDGLDQLDQPEDSNLHGDDIDSDKHDMVSAIRKKMKMRSPISR